MKAKCGTYGNASASRGFFDPHVGRTFHRSYKVVQNRGAVGLGLGCKIVQGVHEFGTLQSFMSRMRCGVVCHISQTVSYQFTKLAQTGTLSSASASAGAGTSDKRALPRMKIRMSAVGGDMRKLTLSSTRCAISTVRVDRA